MSDWYCPACSIYIEPESVTNDERHERCGAALTSGPVDSPYRRALARVIELETANERLQEQLLHYLHECRYCNAERPWTDGTDTEYWCQNCGREQPATWTGIRWVAEEPEMVPARGPDFGDGVWERRQDNPPGVGLINDVVPPDRVGDGDA